MQALRSDLLPLLSRPLFPSALGSPHKLDAATRRAHRASGIRKEASGKREIVPSLSNPDEANEVWRCDMHCVTRGGPKGRVDTHKKQTEERELRGDNPGEERY